MKLKTIGNDIQSNMKTRSKSKVKLEKCNLKKEIFDNHIDEHQLVKLNKKMPILKQEPRVMHIKLNKNMPILKQEPRVMLTDIINDLPDDDTMQMFDQNEEFFDIPNEKCGNNALSYSDACNKNAVKINGEPGRFDVINKTIEELEGSNVQKEAMAKGDKGFEFVDCAFTPTTMELNDPHLRIKMEEVILENETIIDEVPAKHSSNHHVSKKLSENYDSIILLDDRNFDTTNAMNAIKIYGESQNSNAAKQYSCVICAEKFPRKSRLTKHMEIHAGEEPYSNSSCPCCNNEGVKHKKTKSSKKYKTCVVCFKSFVNSCFLRKHMKIHADKPLQPSYYEDEEVDVVSNKIQKNPFQEILISSDNESDLDDLNSSTTYQPQGHAGIPLDHTWNIAEKIREAKQALASKKTRQKKKLQKLNESLVKSHNGLGSHITKSTDFNTLEASECDKERRIFHNVIERKRRFDLHTDFQNLRLLIPNIQHHEKTPKHTILKEAVKECQSLTEANRMNKLFLEQQQIRHKLLVLKFNKLQRNFNNT